MFNYQDTITLLVDTGYTVTESFTQSQEGAGDLPATYDTSGGTTQVGVFTGYSTTSSTYEAGSAKAYNEGSTSSGFHGSTTYTSASASNSFTWTDYGEMDEVITLSSSSSSEHTASGSVPVARTTVLTSTSRIDTTCAIVTMTFDHSYTSEQTLFDDTGGSYGSTISSSFTTVITTGTHTGSNATPTSTTVTTPFSKFFDLASQVSVNSTITTEVTIDPSTLYQTVAVIECEPSEIGYIYSVSSIAPDFSTILPISGFETFTKTTLVPTPILVENVLPVFDRYSDSTVAIPVYNYRTITATVYDRNYTAPYPTHSISVGPKNAIPISTSTGIEYLFPVTSTTVVKIFYGMDYSMPSAPAHGFGTFNKTSLGRDSVQAAVATSFDADSKTFTLDTTAPKDYTYNNVSEFVYGENYVWTSSTRISYSDGFVLTEAALAAGKTKHDISIPNYFNYTDFGIADYNFWSLITAYNAVQSPGYLLPATDLKTDASLFLALTASQSFVNGDAEPFFAGTVSGDIRNNFALQVRPSVSVLMGSDVKTQVVATSVGSGNVDTYTYTFSDASPTTTTWRVSWLLNSASISFTTAYSDGTSVASGSSSLTAEVNGSINVDYVNETVGFNDELITLRSQSDPNMAGYGSDSYTQINQQRVRMIVGGDPVLPDRPTTIILQPGVYQVSDSLSTSEITALSTRSIEVLESNVSAIAPAPFLRISGTTYVEFGGAETTAFLTTFPRTQEW